MTPSLPNKQGGLAATRWPDATDYTKARSAPKALGTGSRKRAAGSGDVAFDGDLYNRHVIGCRVAGTLGASCSGPFMDTGSASGVPGDAPTRLATFWPCRR